MGTEGGADWAEVLCHPRTALRCGSGNLRTGRARRSRPDLLRLHARRQSSRGAAAAGDCKANEVVDQMSSETGRVSLLGGSFNPPHIGHLIAAQFVNAA